MRIHFVRHGESEANVMHVIANHCDGFGLTATGREQVRALRDEMAATTLTGVWSSPLLRAQMTAEALAAPRGLTVTVSEALREFDCGELEGNSDATSWDSQIGILRTWLLEGSFGARLPGGESALEVRDRLTALVSQLTTLRGASEMEVALVGHAGLFVVTLPFLLPQVSHTFAWHHPIGKAGRVVADWTPREARCLSWDGIEFNASP